jgi:hypothetical protein
MKNKLIFLSAIILCLGMVESFIGFSHNNFFLILVGGFWVGASIEALYILKKT